MEEEKINYQQTGRRWLDGKFYLLLPHTKFNMADSTESPMKEYVIQQRSRIAEILGNATLFKEHYTDLTQNIISSMNKQIHSYVKNSKKSIMVDIFKLTVESIDWSVLQAKLGDMLRQKQPNVNPGNWQPLPKPSVSIEAYDEDVLTNMLLNCDVDHAKDFAKYRKLARSQLDELIDDVGSFETELCEYRAQAVKKCESNVNVLFNYHFNYVNDMYYKRSTQSTIVINGKEIKLKKSQQEFITSALKTLICG